MPKRLAATGSSKLVPFVSFFHACEVLNLLILFSVLFHNFVIYMLFSLLTDCFLLYSSYLELAILPCWRFLVDRPVDVIQRLVMMTRGIADPLASAYCRLYIAHCVQKLPQQDTGRRFTLFMPTKPMQNKPCVTINNYTRTARALGMYHL